MEIETNRQILLNIATKKCDFWRINMAKITSLKYHYKAKIDEPSNTQMISIFSIVKTCKRQFYLFFFKFSEILKPLALLTSFSTLSSSDQANIVLYKINICFFFIKRPSLLSDSAWQPNKVLVGCFGVIRNCKSIYMMKSIDI
jgi:hypothetical protein